MEHAASSSEVAVASSDQGAEPSWPRIFHCDLSEEAELPLLAEPRPGAEQVDKLTYFTSGGGEGVLNIFSILFPRGLAFFIMPFLKSNVIRASLALLIKTSIETNCSR